MAGIHYAMKVIRGVLGLYGFKKTTPAKVVCSVLSSL